MSSDLNSILPPQGLPIAGTYNISTPWWNFFNVFSKQAITNPITTYQIGDMVYANGSSTFGTIESNKTTVKKYLSQVGTGIVSTAPIWSTVNYSDVGNITTNKLLGRYSSGTGYSELVGVGQGLRLNSGNLETKSYKNAVSDFGAVGDDSTDNDAVIINIVSWINSTGGIVFFPRGVYRFSSVWPNIDSNGGGILGEGRGTGGYPNPLSGTTYGTVFRHNGTSGDTITITGSIDVVIRDICFWPVKHKTSGSEINNKGRSYHTLVDNCFFSYPFRAITTDGAVFSTYTSCGCSDSFDSAYYCTGTDSSGQHLEGALYIDCTDYHTAPIAEPESESSTSAWATGTTYAQGSNTIANGYIWQASTGGISAGSGSGPTLGTLTNSTDRTTQLITDNTVVWRWIGTVNKASLYLNQTCYHITVQSCKFLTGYWGVRVTDAASSGTSINRYLTFIDLECDHQYSDVMSINAGDTIQIDNCTLESSCIGRGIYLLSGCQGIVNISNSFIFGCGYQGIRVESNVKWINIEGCKIGGNSRQSVGTYNGIELDSGVAETIITANTIRPLKVVIGGQGYGINIGAACDNFVIADNDCTGNSTGGVNNAAGLSSTKLCYNNIGSNTNSSYALGSTTAIAATQGDLIYGSATDVFSKLAKDTNATRYLSNQGTSNNPSWNQVNLANGVTGTLPAARGGTGLSSLGTGIPTFLGTPSSDNLAAAVTDETGNGALVFATSPTLVTPILGTPTSGTLTNCTGLPNTSVTSGLFIKQVTSQLFTSTGTYTPTSGTVYCDIEIVGPGGGGGGGDGASGAAAGGGGGGGYSRRIVAKSTVIGAGTTAAVTIGTGGSGGSSTNNGNGGSGASTVVANGGSGATIVSAGAGGGGVKASSVNGAVGGSGGTSSSGDTNITGGVGHAGGISGSAGGHGGSSFYGSGGQGGIPSTGASTSAAYGAGGGGGQGGGSGSAGANGYCRITEYIA